MGGIKMINLLKEQPIITTGRLLLRPFTLNDGKRVQQLANDKKIAETTLNVPYPYEAGAAEQWISSHEELFKQGRAITYAVIKKDEDTLIGTISLNLFLNHEKAELAYWVGSEYWNKGFCTEAARALLTLGFKELSLNKIYALCFSENIGSSSVMKKIGMKYEGTRREDVKKWGKFIDLGFYSILKSEFEK